MTNFITRYRLLIVTSCTLVVTALSLILALNLRFEFEEHYFLTRSYLGLPLLLLLTFRYAAYLYWDINKRSWRHTSGPELELIIKAHVISSMAFAASIYILRITEFPRSVVFIEGVISVCMMGGIRYISRRLNELRLFDSKKQDSPGERKVLIIGAGDSGHLLVKSLLNERRFGYEPIGVLDDSERLIGTTVHGVPVIGGINTLRSVLLTNKKISAVILTIPSFSQLRVNEIKDICDQCEVPLKRLQTFEDIACLDADAPSKRPDIETLLDKQSDVSYQHEIREKLNGRRVLITGAGGSIGSEIVRQVLDFEPSHLTILDNSELHLFEINREVRNRWPNIEVRPVLANILDARRMKGVLIEESPEIVIHAAAYKHVPLIQENSYAAVTNNILGTRNLLMLCPEFGVKHFVLISTDKAVDPSSIMGSSKRVCELLVQQVCSNGSRMSSAVVRFGNVINSTGSVIPIFKRQIEEGGPITVTHPDIERYFMSIPEAVQLVLTAGILGESGEIFVLDMGRKIKVLEVAKKMLTLYGRRDLPIVFTGLRPGEKITEDLVCLNEERRPTRFARIDRVRNLSSINCDSLRWVAELEERLDSMTEADIGKELLSYAKASQDLQSERAA